MDDHSTWSDMMIYDALDSPCFIDWNRVLHIIQYEHARRQYKYSVTAPTCVSALAFEIGKMYGNSGSVYSGIGNRTTSPTTELPEVATRCLTSGYLSNHNHTNQTKWTLDANISYQYDNESSDGVLFDLRSIVDRAS